MRRGWIYEAMGFKGRRAVGSEANTCALEKKNVSLLLFPVGSSSAPFPDQLVLAARPIPEMVLGLSS